MTALNPVIARVSERIRERSRETRARYLALMARQHKDGPARGRLSCGNLAHAFAASGDDKATLAAVRWPNLAIITAHNDMLSAHQPFATYPERIKAAARRAGATAQIAGGVPAMCDGVTQGRAGMDLSLFSRDVIALATALALSHEAFDAGLLLGVCDKIVPGLLIGALRFGHLPFVFVPAGPMPSGIPNKEKARVRQAFAEGRASRDELLAAEAASYHAPGTCTFYGTANSNQLLLEAMGLMMPGAAFVNPGTQLRDRLTEAAAARVAQITHLGADYRPLSHLVDERTIVNAVVALAASGGSTNHLLHLIAIARAGGMRLALEDFDEISRATPLLMRVYPNGEADINRFAAAGGTAFLIRTLIDSGHLHADIPTLSPEGLIAYTREPALEEGALTYRAAAAQSADLTVLRAADAPFAEEVGIRMVSGEIGRAMVKTSAVALENRRIRAPAAVFSDQEAVVKAFEEGALSRDVVVVLIGQGPRAAGMPELHKLTPALGALLDRGHKVALLTDGRMSGASGKVLAALHMTPEAAVGGLIGRIRDGDLIEIDAMAGVIRLEAGDDLGARAPAILGVTSHAEGTGRELFSAFRALATQAEDGATFFSDLDQ